MLTPPLSQEAAAVTPSGIDTVGRCCFCSAQGSFRAPAMIVQKGLLPGRAPGGFSVNRWPNVGPDAGLVVCDALESLF